MKTRVYGWVVERGESAGLLCPIIDGDQHAVNVDGWDCIAVVLDQPDGTVIHSFEGDALTVSEAGVHLHFSAAVTSILPWRRGWFRVVLTDPFYPEKVSKVVHGPVTVTDV